MLVGARKECPLIVGIGEGENFVASAIPAFLAETRHVMPIENGEIVTINADGVEITDADGDPVERDAEEVDWDEDAAEKGGYDDLHDEGDPRAARRGRRDDRRPAAARRQRRPLRRRASTTSSCAGSSGS